MTDTLYFKDDDSRLSFLQGNYITLTNMRDKDIERVIKYHLSPINISVHTTNPELRCKMLHNRFAGEALKKVDILYQGGIEMNGQIVLCRGVNDGEELERSIRDLTQYLPLLRSVSVVPVGLSKYRDGLYPLEPFTKEEAKEVIRTIEKWQKKVYAEYGIHFIHAGDEWYLLAEEEVPEEERYDGYLQLENGVGMLRLLFNEFEEGYAKLESGEHQEEISLATADLLTKVDCLTNLTDNTVVSSLPAILDQANEKGIPVFGSEIEQVKIGCLAAEGIDYVSLGKDTGKMAAKILKGEVKA